MSAASVAITLDLYRYVDHLMENDAAVRLDVAFQLAKAGAKSQIARLSGFPARAYSSDITTT